MELFNCHRCTNGLCIKKVTMFQSISEHHLREIINLTGHKSVEKGTVLCHEGDDANLMYIINEGIVKLSKYNVEGKEQILDVRYSGQTFGEYHVLSHMPYHYTATTLSATKICTLEKSKLKLILLDYPDINQNIIVELAKQIIKSEDLVQSLSLVNSDSKVAYILLELLKSSPNESIIDLPLSREEMANYAGVTRETMSRRLSEFSTHKIIETIGYKRIKILNKIALEDMI